MKKLFIAALFLSSISFADEFQINDLSGGMHSYPIANRIPDNAATYIQNFYTDIESICVERNGYEKRDSTILGGTKAVTGLWEFVENDGDQWIISFSSRSFYKNTIGATPTLFGPTMTVAQVPDCAVNLGVIMCVNGTDTAWIFNGTSTAAVSGAPLGKLIEPWRTRFIISNITGSQSTVRISEDGDYTNWTLGGLPTDPFSLQIGGANDGFNVTCMWKSYLDNFVIGRKKDLWYLSGFDQADAEVRNVSSEIGCLQQGSMREFDGSLLFLSNRGMEELRGYTITYISEPIRNLTDTIVKNTSSERSNTQTSQSDFGAGSITPSLNLSTTFLPGSISNKTTSYVLTSVSDWGSMSFDDRTYVDTETVSGNLQTTFPDLFSSFRDGTLGTKHVWDRGCSYTSSCSTNASVASGKLFVTAPNASERQFIQSFSPAMNYASGTTYYFTASSFTSYARMEFKVGASTSFDNSNTFRFLFEENFGFFEIFQITPPNASTVCSGVGNCPLSSATFPTSVSVFISTSLYRITLNNVFRSSGTHTASNFMPYFYLGTLPDSSFVSSATIQLDDFSVNPQTFTATTAVFDTGMSSGSYGMLSATLSTTTVTFTTYSSEDGISFDSGVSVNNGSRIASAARRYYKADAFFSQNYSTFPSSSSSMSDLTLNFASTGTFTSQVMDAGDSITSWGPVSIVEQKYGGDIVYQFNSSTQSNISLFNPSSWTNITSGQVPTNSAIRYFAFRSTFSVSVATASLSLDSFQTTWNEGVGAPPIVSWNYDRRYWLAFTTTTASAPYNDKVLVYQRNRTWTLLSGINAGSFATWRDSLYFGASNPVGYVYKFDVGNADDGASINSVIRTKSYDLGIFSREKDFRYMYADYLGDSSFSGSFSMAYDLERSGGSFSLGSVNLNDGVGQLSPRFHFPMSNPVVGREIQYILTKNGTGDRLRLQGFSTNYSIKEER